MATFQRVNLTLDGSYSCTSIGSINDTVPISKCTSINDSAIGKQKLRPYMLSNGRSEQAEQEIYLRLVAVYPLLSAMARNIWYHIRAMSLQPPMYLEPNLCFSIYVKL